MTMKLSGLQPIAPIETPSISSPSSAAGSSAGSSVGSSFSEMLSGAIGEVEGARASANQSVQRFLSGDGGDLHSTILASQRADLEFQMFMQVRNKIVSAYQEIMKLQM
jgi:flagellar hook-basal body complex protein FliE